MSQDQVSWVESAFDHPAFFASKRQAAPSFIVEVDPLRAVWANTGAAALFGARDTEDFTRRFLAPQGALTQKFADLARHLEPGGAPRLERIRLVRGLASRNLTLLCHRPGSPAGVSRLAFAVLGPGSVRPSGPDGSATWRVSAHASAALSATSVRSGLNHAMIGDEPSEQAHAARADAVKSDLVDAEGKRLREAFEGVDHCRFLWRTDAFGRLLQVDGSLFGRLGASVPPTVQQSFAECVATFDAEVAERLRTVLASRKSWSGMELLWPVSGGRVAVPVTLAASPQYEAGRQFGGFRGFGLIDLARIRAMPEAIGDKPPAPQTASMSELPLPRPDQGSEQDRIAASVPDGRLESVDPQQPAAGEDQPTVAEPAITGQDASGLASAGEMGERELAPTEERPPLAPPANVVQLWPLQASVAARAPGNAGSDAGPLLGTERGGDAGSTPAEPDAEASHRGSDPDQNGSLSSSEHFAFQEIARALGAKIEQSKALPETQGASEAEQARPGGDVLARQAALLIENTPAMMAVLRKGKLLFANRALLNRLGVRRQGELPAAVGGGSALELPQGAGETSDAISFTAHDGECVSFVGEARPIDWEGGAAVLWSLRSPGATGPGIRLRSGEREPEERDDTLTLRALLDAAGDAIATIDEAGRVLTLNRQGERWFGEDRRRLAGESFTLLLAPESRALAASLLAEVKAQPDSSVEATRELVARTPEGSSMPLLMTLARIGDGLFSAVWRDLSALKRFERDLARAQREADRASGQQPEFLAKVSHEIRTPLNAILGFAEIMMDERFGPLGNIRYRNYLQDIHASGTHVMSLINDLLDLSRIEAGRLDLDLGSVEINKVIGDCVAQMQPHAHRERVIMRTSLGARLPAVMADERSVRQIVTNLLSNAVKFNEPGGQVIVSTAMNDAGAVVARIRDTGLGMSDADIAAALEPFRQLAPSKQAGGTGLGLPLTKALVGANGASLSIRSRPREGTLVEVMFTPAPAPSARVPA